MNNENKFLDKTTLMITMICIIVLSITGVIFLKIENENKSTIIKADESKIIEETIDSAKENDSLYKNEYDAETFGLININTATKEELMLLENIGEKTADAIIEYRAQHTFKTPHDIVKVYGIGEKTYEKLKDKICVE